MTGGTISLANDTLADQVRTACILECAARKPGNVHPQASFHDVSFYDFVRSAEVIAPLIAQASSVGVGRSILLAVQATRKAVGTNTNLGMILLLAPLAAVPVGMKCESGIQNVLQSLIEQDTIDVYGAIRETHPGGLGAVNEHDVAQAPQISLIEAMTLAAERDLVARQYANGFHDVLTWGQQAFLKWIERLSSGSPRPSTQGRGAGGEGPNGQSTSQSLALSGEASFGVQSVPIQDWETAVIGTQLEIMAREPDSLIARKCGQEDARHSQQLAQDVLNAGWPNQAGQTLLRDFDKWLRAKCHHRNPGTTADLIAAILFTLIRDRAWTPPGIHQAF